MPCFVHAHADEGGDVVARLADAQKLGDECLLVQILGLFFAQVAVG